MLFSSTKKIGIKQNNTEEITESETSPCPPDTFHSNWAKYPGNTRFDLKTDITIALQSLYMRGKGETNKNRRTNAEKAYDIIN